MTHKQQKKILPFGLSEPLSGAEIRVLYALSRGRSTTDMLINGVDGFHWPEHTLYQYRSNITRKLEVDFGSGSRKLHWIAGRYHKEIADLYNSMIVHSSH